MSSTQGHVFDAQHPCTHNTQYGSGPQEGKCADCGEQLRDPTWLIAIKKYIAAGHMEQAAKTYQWHTGSNNGRLYGLRRVRITEARRWVKNLAERLSMEES